MKKLILAAAALLIFIGTQTAQPARAARMGRGVEGWWIGYQNELCRDGATLGWLWDGGVFEGQRSTLRLWEGAIGGRLIGLAPMSPISHTLPVAFATDNSGGTLLTQAYDIRDIGWWPALAPGVTVVIEDAALDVAISGVVQDCLVTTQHRSSIARGGGRVLGTLDLRAPTLAIPESALRYRIESPPAHGALSLNGITLTVGGVFFQSDIAEGRLRYAHSGDNAASDSFGYSLDGLVRVSRGRDLDGSFVEADGASFAPRISANGAVVAFASSASNLDETTSDSGGNTDVFVWLGNGTTRRISNVPITRDSADGPSQSPVVSSDGARVAFASDATNLTTPTSDCPATLNDSQSQVYRRDLGFEAGTGLVLSDTFRQSASSGPPASCQRGNGTSFTPVIAVDRSVAYLSASDNLLLPAVDPDGMISSVFRRAGANTTLLATRTITNAGYLGINGFDLAGSGAGERVLVAATDGFVNGDNNGADDIFVQTTGGPQAGQTFSVSLAANGGAANGVSSLPALSADARFAAFASEASNLVSVDGNAQQDVFVRDLTANTTQRISVTPSNADANGLSQSPRLSADGRWVSFDSEASNLVNGDGNGQADVFLRDRATGKTWLISKPFVLDAGQATLRSGAADISADGRHIVFESLAPGLVVNGGEPGVDVDADVFVRFFDPARTVTIFISTPSTLHLPIVLR